MDCRRFALAVGLLFGLGCHSRVATDPETLRAHARTRQEVVPAMLPQRPVADRLDAAIAADRSRRLTEVTYDLRLELAADDPGGVTGAVAIGFQLGDVDSSQPITVDFAGGRIAAATLDGAPLEPDYNGFFLTLPQDLAAGPHLLTVAYHQPYGHDSVGLHRFEDPEDGRVYLHSYFEPYHANKLFPCFDQPDLRAAFRLQVTAPADYEVITYARANQIDVGSATRTWHFPPSPPISTYVFPLHAGPYRVWEDGYGELSLRLFARQSLADDVDAGLWLGITKRGLGFFEDYFGQPYPYTKYDQLIAPEFSIGGMENVAAVAYFEHHVRPGKLTQEEEEDLASLLLHELSHMWFGDLVTIAWWNGLWLKESFASYMEPLAMHAIGYPSAFARFRSDTQWGMDTDRLVTTHPIEVPVDDTDSGFANFDGITYAKGAAVLKQLSHLLGESVFRDGVRRYLARYAGGATRLNDFIDTLGELTTEDLDRWVATWLRAAGVNTIEAQATCRDGKLISLRLRQSAPADHPVLRRHRLQVGLYARSAAGRLERTLAVPVLVDGEFTPVPVPDDAACPELVYPNADDWGYVEIRLDDASRSALPTLLTTIDDPLLRGQLWQSLWDGVRSASVPIAELARLANVAAASEADPLIARQVFGLLVDTLDMLWRLPGERARELRTRLGAEFEQTLGRRAADPADPELQDAAFAGFVDLAHSDAALGHLAALLDGSATVQGLSLHPDRRWRMVRQLASFDHSRTAALTAAEAERDPSDLGQGWLLAVDAARPDIDGKAAWLERIAQADKDHSMTKQRQVLEALLPANQRSAAVAIAAPAIALLPQIHANTGQLLQRTYVEAALPVLCDDDHLARLQRALERGQLSPILERGLKVAHQEERRCLRILSRLEADGAVLP